MISFQRIKKQFKIFLEITLDRVRKSAKIISTNHRRVTRSRWNFANFAKNTDPFPRGEHSRSIRFDNGGPDHPPWKASSRALFTRELRSFIICKSVLCVYRELSLRSYIIAIKGIPRFSFRCSCSYIEPQEKEKKKHGKKKKKNSCAEYVSRMCTSLAGSSGKATFSHSTVKIPISVVSWSLTGKKKPKGEKIERERERERCIRSAPLGRNKALNFLSKHVRIKAGFNGSRSITRRIKSTS